MGVPPLHSPLPEAAARMQNTRAPSVAVFGWTGAVCLDHRGEQRGWREIKCNERTLGVILFGEMDFVLFFK